MAHQNSSTRFQHGDEVVDDALELSGELEISQVVQHVAEDDQIERAGRSGEPPDVPSSEDKIPEPAKSPPGPPDRSTTDVDANHLVAERRDPLRVMAQSRADVETASISGVRQQRDGRIDVPSAVLPAKGIELPVFLVHLPALERIEDRDEAARQYLDGMLQECDRRHAVSVDA